MYQVVRAMKWNERKLEAEVQECIKIGSKQHNSLFLLDFKKVITLTYFISKSNNLRAIKFSHWRGIPVKTGLVYWVLGFDFIV